MSTFYLDAFKIRNNLAKTVKKTLKTFFSYHNNNSILIMLYHIYCERSSKFKHFGCINEKAAKASLSKQNRLNC